MTKVQFDRLPQPWTPAENEKLRALAASGERPTAISEQLQRSEVAVRHRLWKLGIPVKRIMIASAERTFAIHPERQFMHYLRERRWVKGTTFPPGPVSCQPPKEGLDRTTTSGSKERDLLSNYRRRLSRVESTRADTGKPGKLQSTGVLVELKLKAKK